MAKMALNEVGWGWWEFQWTPLEGTTYQHSGLQGASLNSCISLPPGIQFHLKIWLPWCRGISNCMEKTRGNHEVQGLCSNRLNFNYRKCAGQWIREVRPSLDWEGSPRWGGTGWQWLGCGGQLCDGPVCRVLHILSCGPGCQMAFQSWLVSFIMQPWANNFPSLPWFHLYSRIIIVMPASEGCCRD